MGIPYFFKDVVLRSKGVITHVKTCDRLYLDFNSIIHTCSARLLQERTHFENEDHMHECIFQKIVEYTEQVVSQCPPSKLLMISVDGVAPLAKINQQRKRRHISAYRNEIIEEFKLQNNISFVPWDSNCITPGTAFMDKLDVYLKNYYSLHERPYEVIVSGPCDVGEGEHKIIRHIKESKSLGEINVDRYKDVIYGLDADLIMLALTCNKENIYLMRESTEFGGQHHDVAHFKFVDIKQLIHNVAMYLYNDENQKYMYDYVFICFILGNDFLPHPPFLSIKHGAVDTVCNTYRELHKQTGQFALHYNDGKYTVNIEFLNLFLQELSKSEDIMFKQIVKDYMQSNYYDKHFKNALDKFIYELDNEPSKNKKKLIDPSIDPIWRINYWYHMLGINPYTEMVSMDTACKEYLDGILWNVDYYFNNIHSNKWFFRYNFAPPVQDLVRYLKKNSWSYDTLDGVEIDIQPYEQLVFVLPYRSKQLVPSKYQKVYDQIELGCSHYFPRRFKMETFLKRQLWECMPILPTINPHHIKGVMKIL